MENYKVVVNRTREFDDESLFHSDTFLGDEFLDEMYHWKYIKREKKDGKWRYYYDYNNGKYSDKKGIEIGKTKDGAEVTLFDTTKTEYWDTHQKGSKKQYGPVKVSYAEDGVEYTLNISTKKIKSFSKGVVDAGRKRIAALLGIH